MKEEDIWFVRRKNTPTLQIRLWRKYVTVNKINLNEFSLSAILNYFKITFQYGFYFFQNGGQDVYALLETQQIIVNKYPVFSMEILILLKLMEGNQNTTYLKLIRYTDTKYLRILTCHHLKSTKLIVIGKYTWSYDSFTITTGYSHSRKRHMIDCCFFMRGIPFQGLP